MLINQSRSHYITHVHNYMDPLEEVETITNISIIPGMKVLYMYVHVGAVYYYQINMLASAVHIPSQLHASTADGIL